MQSWLRFDRLTGLILLIGILQYGPTVFSGFQQGSVSTFEFESFALEDAGALRYIKEAFLVLLSLAWPIWMGSQTFPQPILRVLNWYLPWLLLVIALGSVAFLLDYSPIFFVWSGLRWVTLMHASFGLFLLSKCSLDKNISQQSIATLCLCLGAADLAFALQQLAELSVAWGAKFAEARVTGFFGHAGPAAFFGFSLALICMHLDRVSFRIRLAVSGTGFLIALSTGTRSMVIFIFAIVVLQIVEFIELHHRSFLRKFRNVLFLPVVTIAALLGYGWLNAIVDRGDLISQQFEDGRAVNFVKSIQMLYAADVGEFVFGRGLGISTNTAYGQVLAQNITPEIYRFNFLVDNAILTTFFQLGLLGSMIFWSGILLFVAAARPKVGGVFRRRYWLTATLFFAVLWVGNPFEQYFLMLPFAASLGCAYWAGIAATSAKVSR